MISTTIVTGVQVNLNLLETFLLVAEHRSFSVAASRVGRSSSAVSNQIKQLEEQLSITLFERTTRTVQLTAQGEVLRESVRKALAEIRQTMAQLQAQNTAGPRKIRIACNTSLAWQLLPPILDTFRAQHRNTLIEVNEISSSLMLEPLLAGEVAFAIGALNRGRPEVDCESFLMVPFVALLPVSMPQSGLSSITLRELSTLPLLLSHESSQTRRTLLAAFERAGLTPRIKHEGVRFHTILAMVGAGQGVAAFSELSSRRHAERGFRRVPISDRGLALEVGVMKPHARKLTRLEEALLDLVRKEAVGWRTTLGNAAIGTA